MTAIARITIPIIEGRPKDDVFVAWLLMSLAIALLMVSRFEAPNMHVANKLPFWAIVAERISL
jgi:hypothetical protein